MRLLLQRVSRARVDVDGKSVGQIGQGLMVLAGFGADDGADLPQSPLWNKMIDKMLGLRIFEDEAGKMNKSLADVGGGLLLVSQFTLYADCKKGRRPSFTKACPPALAEELFNALADDTKKRAPGPVQTGVFGAMMELDFVNSGPVTIMLDSAEM